MLGNKIGGIFVECRTSSSETMVTLSPYRRGNAPVQLINQTKHHMIEYAEKDNQGRCFLAPGESVYFTWVKPQGDRILTWSLSGLPEEHQNSLLSDDRGVVQVSVIESFLSHFRRNKLQFTPIECCQDKSSL
jgi:hypothetical protein